MSTTAKTSLSLYSIRRLLGFFALLIACFATNAFAGQVNLGWNASTGPVAGYKVYYRTASEMSYTSNIDAGAATTATVASLADGETYYFAVKSYDSVGKESGFSNETIQKTAARTTTTSPTTTSPTTTTPTTTTPTTTTSTTSTSTTAAPVSSFTATPTSGVAPLLVTLTDTSTGSVTERVWDFGDGTSSTTQSAVKTYDKVGSFTVKLTVKNASGSNTSSQTISTSAASPVANFSATPTSGIAPLPVIFTNSSTGTVVSYSWNFGDNTTSTEQNPTHTYTQAGTYNVKLTTTGVTGTTPSTKMQTITVSSATATTNSGLVAAYNFEEVNSDGKVVDVSGKGNHGVLSGSATRINSGKYGKALSLDGINSLATFNHSTSLNLTASMTLEAWVQPTEAMTGWKAVITKQQNTGVVYQLVANNAANQPAAVWSTSKGQKQVNGKASLPANQWTHLAATYDGKQEILYINGVKVANQTQSGTLVTSTGKLVLGGNDLLNQYFKGYIDEVRIYGRALSATEIQTDMNKAIATTSPPKLLLGAQTLGTSEYLPQGTAAAFQTTVSSSGLFTGLSVYVDQGSESTNLIVGLYADNNGRPGSRIMQGGLSSLQAGAWNKLPLTVTSLTAGQKIWIAILSTKGMLKFHNKAGTISQPSETSASTSLTSLPGSWSTGTISGNGPLSGYGFGY